MPPARGCKACRDAKVKCDGQRPVCQRCVQLGRDCFGYRDAGALVIRDQQAVARRGTTRRQSPSPPKEDQETEIVVDSKYIPPLRPVESRVYPWLPQPTLDYLQIPIEDAAIGRFFAQFILFPYRNIGDDGYLADLPYFYSHCTAISALNLGVQACSLVSLARAMHQQVLYERANGLYQSALRALSTIISSESEAARDETLMTVLVLSFYENLIGDHSASGSAHIQALTPILKLRGVGQLQSTVGWNMFRVAHRRLQFQKLLLREDPMPESSTWLQALDGSSIEVRIARSVYSISVSCAHARRLMRPSPEPDSSIGSKDNPGGPKVFGMHTLQDTLDELQKLDVEARRIEEDCPAHWLPTSFTQPLDPSTSASTHPLTYENIWICSTWQYHRAFRLLLYETMIDWYAFLATLSPLPPSIDLDRPQTDGHRLIQDNLATLPFLLGYNGPNRDNSNPELGHYFAKMCLDWLKVCRLTTTEQSTYIEQLDDMIQIGFPGTNRRSSSSFQYHPPVSMSLLTI